MFGFQRYLKQLKKDSAPAGDFKHALWSDISLKFDKDFGAEGHLHWKLAVIPVATVAVFALMGTGVYAYASPNVSDGHPLYPVKRCMEQVEQVFVVNPDAQRQFQLFLMQRRMQEMQMRAQMIPLQLRGEIEEIKESVDQQDLTDDQKRKLFHEEVETLLEQSTQ